MNNHNIINIPIALKYSFYLNVGNFKSFRIVHFSFVFLLLNNTTNPITDKHSILKAKI